MEKGYKMCLMMEYFPFDLGKLIDKQKIEFSVSDIRIVMRQVLHALESVHDSGFMHRDVKPSNILLNKDGECVLIDFGISRKLAKEGEKLTKNVITRWYRPPELLFGSQEYNESVDIWGLGCVLAELALQKPLFQADSDLNQICKIFEVTGNPNDVTWPDAKNLPFFFTFNELEGTGFDNLFKDKDSTIKQLVEKMLQLDPKKRVTVKELTKDVFFDVSQEELDAFKNKLSVVEL